MIDTLRFSRRMALAGLVREHAEAIAEGLADEVREAYPTKLDLERGFDGIRAKMRTVEAAMQKDNQTFRVEIHREIAEMHKSIRDLAWRMAGLLLAQGAAIVVLIRFVP